ncbi:thiolase family protein [Nocardia sp. NPDC004711]
MPLREVAISGVYQTAQGDMSDRSQADVWWECARGALDDAGLEVGDIDGLVGEPPNGAGIRAGLPGAALGYDLLAKPLRFHATSTIGAAASAAGLNLAVYAVASGRADCVVIVNAVAGPAEGYLSANRDSAVAAMGKLSGPYEYVYGTTRVSDYAVFAMRHMHEFGTTPEQLAEVAVAQRAGAILHPLSVNGRRGPITVDDVLGSRMIADPLHLLDCCAINQGGGAIVVTTAEDARSKGRPVVSLLGYGEGHSHIDPNSLPSLAEFPSSRLAADQAFAEAGISRDDVDVTGIGDHFTINVILGLEGAGFCKPGEGGSFVESGALRLSGSLPTNTAGGFLSFSHAGRCGLFTLIEVVEQLRGTAGLRQVQGAQYGFVNGVGGAMQNNFAAILGRN